MEWSKDKTMKLIELMQVNASLWNPSLCETRRDKQKRREELRTISDILEVYVADVTRKIQHLRTQYNRESARELRANYNAENPDERYVSSWYAYEYLHFLKESTKPYRVFSSDQDNTANNLNSHSYNPSDYKHTNLSSPLKISRTEFSNSSKPDPTIISSRTQDDLSIFGEYVAIELRSLKGEKNLLVAKKRILDIIFEVKLNSACDLTDNSDNLSDCKHASQAPPNKIARNDVLASSKSDAILSDARTRDDLSVFGDYVANELRSLKGEKNLLIAKKKILDIIFDVKMGSICESRPDPPVCTVFADVQRPTNSIHNDKVFVAPNINTAQIEPLTVPHSTPTTGISEIIINSACHYSNFKVDNQ